MTLRRATDADAAAVGRIHVESWNVAYRGIMPDDVIAKTDLVYRTLFWAERIADRDWPVFVIEEQDECVAFCHMIASRDPDDDPKEIGQITSLHVLPWVRGHGHGRLLMNHVLGEFRNRGYTAVTLWVLEQNLPARRFYEQYGFRLDTATRRYPRTEVPEVRYRIQLSNAVPPR